MASYGGFDVSVQDNTKKECIDKARQLIAETKRKMEEGKQC